MKSNRQSGRGVRAAQAESAGFSQLIDEAVPELGATLDGGEPAATVTADDEASDDGRSSTGFGRYRLGRLLGEGGMGSVYEAEQLQPVQRRVAVKLIKLGMDTQQVVARFSAERQVLALMDHPGIAKVFDAGATAHGRPFFAMELVHGEPITRYCDAHSLSIRQRLELFAQACDAVQHAHQKGVIHRDIKPSNVLVSGKPDRGSAQPEEATRVKIIDFGIAKATAGNLGDVTLTPMATAVGVLGTPEYMSPEQAAGDVARIDTRTDVYALGVLLYELLSGMRPFTSRSTPHATPEDLRALIREADPPRPSTRLSNTAGSGEDVTELARRRDTQPGTLARMLRRELEWIPLKAMRKAPEHRYGSAAELAQDVRNYLEGLPLLAAPPSTSYRIRKTLRRHRGAFLTAAAVALALVVGIATSTWFAVDARRQAKRASDAETAIRVEQARTLEQMNVAELRRAEAQEQRAEALVARQEAEEVNQFLVDLLDAASPARTHGRELTVVEAVGQAAETIDRKYLDRPRLAATVKVTAGQTLTKLSRLEEAEKLLREGLDLREKELGPDHPQTGEAMLHLAGVLDRRGGAKEAEELARKAIAAMTPAYGAEAPLVLGARQKLAQTLNHQRRSAEAEPMHRELLEIHRRLSGPSSAESLSTTNGLGSV